MEVDDNEWLAWNLAIFANDNGQVVPHHPNDPGSSRLDLSGSSMRFLRGDGPDISLEQAFNDIVASDGSSSSSDATSNLAEECPCFTAAQQRCTNILIFNRKGLLSDVFTRAPAPVVVVIGPI